MRQARRAMRKLCSRRLRESLGLDAAPARLECFDISHTGWRGHRRLLRGVHQPKGRRRKEYRRFNIESVDGGDDYGALREAVGRRYARIKAGEFPRPDVLLIDGGAGQVNAVMPVLPTLGFADPAAWSVCRRARTAGRDRNCCTGATTPGEVLSLPPDSPALRVIQRVRDEAHRFAIQGHRRKRARRHQESVLETVPGLGPAKRRDLLQHFGGLQGVLKAGVDDLAQVHGIGTLLARGHL